MSATELRRLPDEEVTVNLYPSGRFAVGAHVNANGVVRYSVVHVSELAKPHTSVEDLKSAVIKLVDMRSVEKRTTD